MTQSRMLEDYPFRTYDKLRYGDTDRQGHINNAVFSTLFETGRVAFIHNPEAPFCEAGTSFVLARIAIDFLAEVHWPGTVDIGTRVARIGRSSIGFEQAVFQDGRCAAVSESVLVMMRQETGRPAPLPPYAVAWLTASMEASKSAAAR